MSRNNFNYQSVFVAAAADEHLSLANALSLFQSCLSKYLPFSFFLSFFVVVMSTNERLAPRVMERKREQQQKEGTRAQKAKKKASKRSALRLSLFCEGSLFFLFSFFLLCESLAPSSSSLISFFIFFNLCSLLRERKTEREQRRGACAPFVLRHVRDTPRPSFCLCGHADRRRKRRYAPRGKRARKRRAMIFCRCFFSPSLFPRPLPRRVVLFLIPPLFFLFTNSFRSRPASAGRDRAGFARRR